MNLGVEVAAGRRLAEVRHALAPSLKVLPSRVPAGRVRASVRPATVGTLALAAEDHRRYRRVDLGEEIVAATLKFADPAGR